MAKRGPLPQPKRLHDLKGGKARGGGDHLPALGGAPACPEWLSDEARAIWRRVVPDLDELGILARVDEEALATYCTAAALYREAIEMARKEGQTIIAANGFVQPNPYLTLARQHQDTARKWAAELGTTPTARARLNVNVPANTERNPFDEIDDLLA